MACASSVARLCTKRRRLRSLGRRHLRHQPGIGVGRAERALDVEAGQPRFLRLVIEQAARLATAGKQAIHVRRQVDFQVRGLGGQGTRGGASNAAAATARCSLRRDRPAARMPKLDQGFVELGAPGQRGPQAKLRLAVVQHRAAGQVQLAPRDGSPRSRSPAGDESRPPRRPASRASPPGRPGQVLGPRGESLRSVAGHLGLGFAPRSARSSGRRSPSRRPAAARSRRPRVAAPIRRTTDAPHSVPPARARR